MDAKSICLACAAALWTLAGCGPSKSAAPVEPSPQSASEQRARDVSPRASAPATAVAVPAAAVAGGGGAVVSPGREVVNPDKSTMVLLYMALAGLTPPIDEWVESDARVRNAAPIDKAARRSAVRAELESSVAAARGIGRVRVTLADAGISDYDPAYQEFTVRSLGPSSELDYSAFGQHVKTRFDNGETAQLWHVPTAQAQALRDRLQGGRGAELDVLLKVTGAQPGPGGGTLTTEVVDYTLRSRDGSTLGRVQVGKG